MSQCQLIKSFIIGLNISDRHWIDVASNVSILELGNEESYELMQKISRNNYDSELVRMITILDLQETLL